MKSLRLIVSAAVLAAVTAPASFADGRNPGSALVYTVHRSGPSYFTVASVTNTNLQPATPFSFGGSTLVHYEYVNVVPNPADPCLPLNCVIFDRVEFLTPADTLSVLTSCHNAVSPTGQQGYLVISAQDPAEFDCPWAFDYLIGSELVVNASGGMYSINAIPFAAGMVHTKPCVVYECLEPSPLWTCGTDVDGEGDLDFDGIEYEPAPDYLMGEFIAIGGSQLAMINLTGGPMARNTLQFDIWNDNEFPLSTTKTFACWFDITLTMLSPLFSREFLASVPNDPGELDLTCNGVGNLETGWFRVDSIDVSSTGGNYIASDGVILGSLTAGVNSTIDGGNLLWESYERQCNGAFQDLQVDEVVDWGAMQAYVCTGPSGPSGN